MNKRTALLLLAMATALTANAEIYKWTDKDGNVQFSDVPPPTGEVKTLREAPPRRAVTGGNAADSAAKPKTLAEKELEFKQRRAAAAEAEAKAQKENSETAERQRACSDTRNQLAALKSGQRIGRFNSDGQRVIIDDREREDEIARMTKQVEEVCK